MRPAELKVVMAAHAEWLRDPATGAARAILAGADLSRAYLEGADLAGADTMREVRRFSVCGLGILVPRMTTKNTGRASSPKPSPLTGARSQPCPRKT